MHLIFDLISNFVLVMRNVFINPVKNLVSSNLASQFVSANKPTITLITIPSTDTFPGNRL
ncbi:hypothetical protein BpHYR1_042764 [Brachionus plicatilis]|uniref:Uncharacterized protein n=1 Tax=Brachionus plicatilis TaxID=10195 RepID=A0A3M7P343_BRAPC|nr:hypothetical protein BpHYR1_042764 [Brachionus plicatilis]